MALPWNKRNVQVQIEEMTKQNVPIFAGDMNVDRIGKGKDVQKININGITTFNELGELKDYNKSYIGAITGDSGYFTIVCDTGDKIYSRAYISVTDATNFYRFQQYTDAGSVFITPTDPTKESLFSIVSIATLTNAHRFRFFAYFNSANDFTFDYKKVTAVNLTKMGKMPISLQIKFSKTYFSELTVSECDLIFNFDIDSFENLKQKTIIKNKGVNAWDKTFDEIVSSNSELFTDGKWLYFPQNNTGSRKTLYQCCLKPNTIYTVAAYGENGLCQLFVTGGDGLVVDSFSKEGNIAKVTTSTTELGEFLIQLKEADDNLTRFKDFQITENSEYSQYFIPEIKKIIPPELNGINGIYSDLDYKRIEHKQITITSNSGTTPSSGTGECTLVNDSTGDVYRGTISGTSVTVTAPNGTYQIFYVLTTLEKQDSNINLLNKYLNSEHNNYIGESYNSDEFSGDGSTTAFTLSTTADDANYDVFIAGIKQESGVTKTTTNFTFDSAPKNGAIIETEYNRTTNSSWFATLNVYEPSGTLNTRAYETTISAQSNDRYYEPADDLGNTEQIEQSSDYTVTLTFDLFENVQSFADEWKGKKFRIIIENISETATTYTKDIFAVCEIIDSSVDYIEGTETVTIKATDYYMNVT